MATCEITTFETLLSPSRNALVDDIDVYLHQDCTARYHNTDFGFLKMALDMEVILPLGQNDVMQNEFGNYAEIVQSDRIWYYFITSCEWVSQNAVKVKLSIDSINTFREDLEWSPQTTIEREHLDRLFLGGDNKIYRYIDPEPENILTTKHIESKTKLLQNNQDINWYLIYDSELSASGEDTSRPVRCRCIADQALTVYKSTSTGPAETWTSSDIGAGQYYYMNLDDNDLITLNLYLPVRNVLEDNWQNIDVSTGTQIIVDGPRRQENIHGTMINFYTYWRGTIDGFRVSAYNGNVRVAFSLRDVAVGESTAWRPNGLHIPGTYNTAPDFTNGGLYYDFSSIVVKQLAYYRFSTRSDIPISYSAYVISDSDKVNSGIGSTITRTTIPFSDVDRTDSRLIKIINLPYAPCTVTYNSSTGVYTFPSEWVYESGFMRLKDGNLNTEFGTTVQSIDLTNTIIDTFDTNNTRNVTDVRREWRESKMFSSQFSTYKLVYDSFSLEVPLENIYYYDQGAIGMEDVNVPITFDITFKPSNTMNSHFAFYADLDSMIYDNPNLWDGTRYLHHGDYDEYVITTRNNEESIFSSAYLDYIRNGYNYDKKVKADQATMSYLMGGLQVAGAIVSFAAGTVTGGVSVAAGVALATSAITTFASAAHNDAAAGEKINQKLKELALQGVNVSGGDDVDLLKFYAGNKAYWIRYVTDAHQYYPLLDLFHYCGYKHPRHEVPNVTSRYWFNFIQCAPIFSNEGQFVWQNYLDDIRARYRAGVTVYHRHPGKLTDTAYDWDQTHENWENSLLTGEIDAEVEVNHTQYYDEYNITGQITNRKHGDVIDFEWYWDAQSWADKDPDDTTNVAVNANGSFSEDNHMQGGIAIRARVRNTVSGKTYSWHTIWESYEPRYSASSISNLWIDDDGYIGCRLDSTKSVLATDYIQFQYFRNGDTSGTPDVDARYNGPISTGTHTPTATIDRGQYAWQGSVIRARIVGVTDSRDTTAWVTKVQ